MELKMKLDVIFEKANVILKDEDIKNIVVKTPLMSIKFLKEKAINDLILEFKRKIDNARIYDNFYIDYCGETKKWILVGTYEAYHGSAKEIKDSFTLTDEESDKISKTLEMFQMITDFFI